MVYFVLVFENFTHGHHVYITPAPPMSSPPSPIHSFFFTIVAHIHIVCVHVHVHACVCVCVYMTYRVHIALLICTCVQN